MNDRMMIKDNCIDRFKYMDKKNNFMRLTAYM